MVPQHELFETSKTNTITNRNREIQISGLSYKPDFITEDEENKLINVIDKQPWLNDLKRRVQHYGYKYDYKAHKINEDMKIADLPDWTHLMVNNLVESEIFRETPDQVIVNEYLPGQGIASHIDCIPCFDNTVASLSLSSRCVMNLTDENDETKPLLLEPRSLVVLQDDARLKWKHGIKNLKTDNYFGKKFKRDRRISLTFRKVILNN